MGWKVEFYNEKVMDDIQNWPVHIKAKCSWIINLIEEFGLEHVGMPHIKGLERGLFEIRAQGKEGIGRAFFCTAKGKKVIILHGFIKKTQQTPEKELKIAKKRMLEIKQ